MLENTEGLSQEAPVVPKHGGAKKG